MGSAIAHHQGDNTLALTRLQTGLTLAPNHFEMLDLLGRVQKNAHDFVRSEKSFRACLSVKPDYATARRNLALLLLETAQPHLALEEITALSAKDKSAPKMALARVICLKDCNRLDEAMRALEALETEESKTYDFERGQILTSQGKYDAALRAYDAAVSNNKNAPQAIKNTAQILAMTGQWKKAQKRLSAAAKTAGPETQAAIADCYIKAGDSSRAKKIIKAARKNQGDHPALLKASSEIALHTGHADEAHTLAKAALTAAPGQLDLMAQFARASLAAGKINDVMVAAEGALKAVPNDQFWIAMLATGGRASGQNYQYYYDYKNLVRAYDLTPPQGYPTIEAFNAELSKALAELHIFDAAPLDQSLRLGTQTEFDLRFAPSAVIQAFFEMIDGPIRDYIAKDKSQPPHPIARRNSGNYRLSGAWSVRLTKGGFHVNHVHPQGWLSSSYYVDVPQQVAGSIDKEGWIQFGQPPSEISDMPAEHSIEPKAGRLVLFPSYMWHGTIPIKGKAQRLTFPFDVVPA